MIPAIPPGDLPKGKSRVFHNPYLKINMVSLLNSVSLPDLTVRGYLKTIPHSL